MQSFKRAVIHHPSFEEFFRKNRAQFPQLTESGCRELYGSLVREEAWINDGYQVNVDKHPRHGFPGMILWHLSIKRLDKEAIHDWRDLQEIKNQICGPEIEAIELYPAESRLVDSANQYHLWVFMTPGAKVPVGFNGGRLVTNDAGMPNTKQRPRIE